jgi:Mrp family chromosome partitioning ATPase
VTDVGIIGQMCNGVIMLVRLNFTPEPVARRAVRLLRVNKVPIMGCLLIGQDERSVGYGYAYNYYRYYGYRDSDSKR